MEESQPTRLSSTFSLALVKLFSDGEMTTGDLAKKLHTSSQNTSIALRNLKRCGYVEMKNGLYDSRKRTIMLTEKGQVAAGLAFSSFHAARIMSKKEGFRLLPNDEDERQLLEELKNIGQKIRGMLVTKKKGKIGGAK